MGQRAPDNKSHLAGRRREKRIVIRFPSPPNSLNCTPENVRGGSEKRRPRIDLFPSHDSSLLRLLLLFSQRASFIDPPPPPPSPHPPTVVILIHRMSERKSQAIFGRGREGGSPLSLYCLLISFECARRDYPRRIRDGQSILRRKKRAAIRPPPQKKYCARIFCPFLCAYISPCWVPIAHLSTSPGEH